MIKSKSKPRSKPEAWQITLYASFIAQLLSIVAFNASIPFIPLFIIKDLHVNSQAQAGLWAGGMTAASCLAMAAFSPIWGILADRYGRKSMVLRAMMAGCVLTALMSVCPNVEIMLGLRILQGALTGTVTANVALVASATPKERVGYALGVIQTAVFTGASIGPLLGGTLADLTDYRLCFLSTSVVLVLSSLIVFFFVHEAPIERPATAPQVVKLTLGEKIHAFFNQKEFLAMVAVLALVQFATSVISPVLALFIQMLNGTSKGASSLAGLELGITGIASAFSAVGAGRLSDRYGHHRVLLISSLGAALLYFPQALVENVWQLLVLRGLMGLFIGGVIPSANAIIADLIPEGRKGAAFGLVSSIGALGMSLGPLVGASIAFMFNTRAVFLVTGLVLLLDAFQLMRMSTAKTSKVVEPKIITESKKQRL